MLDVQLLAPQTTRALRREEYDRLVAMGAFEDERVELISDQAHCVIEVANSSVSKDRNTKAPLYAASGFLEYWLVNFPEQVVEVFRAPGPDGYAQGARYALGETIALEAFPDVRIEVTSLF